MTFIINDAKYKNMFVYVILNFRSSKFLIDHIKILLLTFITFK